ncbi:unnamed protein product [Caenorhabditis bovis]|uniref:BZIP domain-containing protein n=1 Tax=Caenorhabditis bovis TaxID=2654633 RepID=A0A8S1F630_9PELO|nr:unnamed protein product [Caenorhabditis bovis]
MQTSWDAEDFMKRGLLGSLIGFRKRSSSKTDQGPSKQPAAASTNKSASSGPNFTELLTPQPEIVSEPVEHRTEYDIYREIVSEAQLIERSSPATPLSEFSSPTTPTAFYPQIDTTFGQQMMASMDESKLPYPPYHMVMTSTAPHPIPVDQNGVPLGMQCPMAPPPYTSFAPTAQTSHQPAPMPMEMPQITGVIKREIQEHLGKAHPSSASIEKIVKLLVTVLNDSQINEAKEESPEEILRRKRVQNNLAAARYRKRQREAREIAEQELEELSRKNEELKNTVAMMEQEINNLKNAVLQRD